MTVICLKCRRPIPTEQIHTCPGGPSQEMLQIDALMAERDEAREVVRNLHNRTLALQSERDTWKARCEVAEAAQQWAEHDRDAAREQIARLRGSLVEAERHLVEHNAEYEHHTPYDVLNRIRAILKETQT